MIDPDHITNYNLSKKELQYHSIFWLLVAGKTARVIAPRMKLVFEELEYLWARDHSKRLLFTLNVNLGHYPPYPFQLIKNLCKRRNDSEWLARILKKNGIGCYKNKAKGMIELANSNLDLRKCSPDDLEKIHGIGMKTSRCFILHSRKNAQYSGLDTHLLRLMRDLGYDVPESTPSTKKKYLEIEQMFLDMANKTNKTPAELDLIIWRVYSSHKHLKPILLKILKEY